MERFIMTEFRGEPFDETDLIEAADDVEQSIELGRQAAIEAEQGENPPAWAVDEAIWERAKKVVRGSRKKYDNPWAVITHVYKKMGGKIKGK